MQAFDALDAALSTPSRDRYRQRIEENYDLEGIPTFSVWKKLYKSVKPSHVDKNGETETSQPSQHVEQANECQEPSLPESNLLKEVLTYPNLEPKVSKRVNVKRTIPNFVSGHASKQILLDEKLKKSRQLADKQNRLKEAHQRKEEKRKKVEEDKVRREEKKQERERVKQQKLGKANNNQGTKRNSTERIGRGRTVKRTRLTFETSSTNDENICSVCSIKYIPSDDENNPWVMCDMCNSWMHIECVPNLTTPFSILTNLFIAIHVTLKRTLYMTVLCALYMHYI